MFRFVPPATRTLILVNALVYVLQLVTGQLLETLFALWPIGDPRFEPWQLLTYAFLHDPHNIWHIVLNMFPLFMFGGALEGDWGARRLVLYYLVCVCWRRRRRSSRSSMPPAAVAR